MDFDYNSPLSTQLQLPTASFVRRHRQLQFAATLPLRATCNSRRALSHAFHFPIASPVRDAGRSCPSDSHPARAGWRGTGPPSRVVVSPTRRPFRYSAHDGRATTFGSLRCSPSVLIVRAFRCALSGGGGMNRCLRLTPARRGLFRWLTQLHSQSSCCWLRCPSPIARSEVQHWAALPSLRSEPVELHALHYVPGCPDGDTQSHLLRSCCCSRAKRAARPSLRYGPVEFHALHCVPGCSDGGTQSRFARDGEPSLRSGSHFRFSGFQLFPPISQTQDLRCVRRHAVAFPQSPGGSLRASLGTVRRRTTADSPASDHSIPLTRTTAALALGGSHLRGPLSFHSGIKSRRDCRGRHSCEDPPKISAFRISAFYPDPRSRARRVSVPATPRKLSGLGLHRNAPDSLAPNVCLTSGRSRSNPVRRRSLHPDATARVSAATGHTSEIRDPAPHGRRAVCCFASRGRWHEGQPTQTLLVPARLGVGFARQHCDITDIVRRRAYFIPGHHLDNYPLVGPF